MRKAEFKETVQTFSLLLVPFGHPDNKLSGPPRRGVRGLTLPEVLVTLAILLIVLVAVLEMAGQTARAWKVAANDPFGEAQEAFESMARHLGAATLESYPDYADSSGAFRTNGATGFVPDHVARRSDLAFVCGVTSGTNGLLASTGRTTTGCGVFFLVPEGYTQTYPRTGLERLLNAFGYFVEFGDDESAPSFVRPMTHCYRWRLKQVRQTSESLQVYASTSSAAWLENLVPRGGTTSVLAMNVATLLVVPERSGMDKGTALASDFSYDSRNGAVPLTRHQLPPRVRLVLVAIDETSAQHLAALDGSTPPALVPAGLFQDATKVDADLATLDKTLTVQKINHRTFQRDVSMAAASWAETASQ